MTNSNFERRLYGHRGASQRLPENTLPAFARALEDGADAIETDVHLTADGHVVISHDDSGERRAGVNRLIRQCTWDEVSRWVVGRTPEGEALRMPSLGEALERFPAVRFNVDIKTKSKDAALRTMDVVSRHNATDRVTLASFHDEVLGVLHDEQYGGAISLGPREVLQVIFAPRFVSRRIGVRGSAVQVPTRVKLLRLDTREFIARCHSLGLRVDYWVINDPDEARRLLDLGADGIVTDDPATIAPVMQAATAP